MKKDIDLNKLSKREITKFARKLAATNTALWNAVCMVEELVCDPIFKSYMCSALEHEEFLKKLSFVFKKLKKKDEEFINIMNNESCFQDYDRFTNMLEDYFDE